MDIPAKVRGFKVASKSAGGQSQAKLSFGIAVVLVVAAALVDSGALAWLLTPIILSLVFYAAWKAPLRHSLTALAMCGFLLENPNEPLGGGYYASPFFSVGFAMLSHLNNLTGVRALAFSGTDVVLVTISVVALIRESSRAQIDRAGRIETPKPLLQLTRLSLLAAFGVWMLGLATGGDFSTSLWQLEKVVYTPWLCWLWSLALRGPEDLAGLAKALVAAAVLRAILAIYVVLTVVPPRVDPLTGLAQLPYATGHSDSVLFASALVLLLLVLIERLGGAKLRRQILLIAPVLIWGMVANNRRLVWVHVAGTLLTLYIVSPDNPIKRRVRRLLYVVVPIFSTYLAIGWNQTSGIYEPARIVRSLVEPSTDSSSLWREMENFNLIFTIKLAPILGHGYGHPWIEVVPLPVVAYNLEYYLPHNSLLGLFYCAGVVGYTLITLYWAAGVYFGMRAYHAATTATQRVSAILCVGAVLVYQMQAFGDIGLGCWMGVHILAPSLVAGAKLAVARGAWPATAGTG